jgi:hypothetical protein
MAGRAMLKDSPIFGSASLNSFSRKILVTQRVSYGNDKKRSRTVLWSKPNIFGVFACD